MDRYHSAGLTRKVFCCDCKPFRKPSEGRIKRQSMYNRRAWRVARAAFLSRPENVLCRDHQARGELVVATVVDHIKRHMGDEKLFWDEENWQALCASCHNKKSRREQLDEISGR